MDIDTAKTVRSGDFVIGRMQLYSLWSRNHVLWAPTYPDSVNGELTPATIVATRLNSRNQARHLELQATSIRPGAMIYAEPLRLPWYGRWMMVVTSGANWGCFIYTL